MKYENHQPGKSEMVYYLTTCLLAAVWGINGLYCKILGLVPRHEQIVGVILGKEYAHKLTLTIGLGEIGIALWILSGLYKKLCGVVQVILVITMNLIEFFVAPHLLLFGKFNLIVAIVFVMLLAWHYQFLKFKKRELPSKTLGDEVQ